MPVRARILLGFLASSLVFAQTAAQTAKFGIADVHVSPPSLDYHKRTIGGAFLFRDQFQLHRATMLDLITIAWNTDQTKVLGGPAWLDIDRFEVQAKTPPGTTRQTVGPMLQSLLAERFGLAVHNAATQVPGWVLTAGKSVQMKKSESTADSGCKGDMQNGFMSLACHNVTMAELTQRAGNLPGGYFDDGAVIADHTGLDGNWDFTLKFNPRGAGVTAGAHPITLFEGIDQLGLKLEPAMVDVDAIVVDRVNQKPTPNLPDAATAFPNPLTEFEVSVVKPSPPGEHTLNGYAAGADARIQYLPGGRVNAQSSLFGLVRWVWGINTVRIVGLPSFAEADSWDVQGKAPADVGDSDTLTEMLKSLLITRFKLAVHTEERPLPSNTLIAVKPKMKKADPNERSGCKEGPDTPTKNDPRDSHPLLSRLLTCRNVSMSQFAYLLFRGMASGYVGGPAFDATGLEGGWDFTLSFSAPTQLQKAGADGTIAEPDGSLSLAEAMEKQIGIRMEMQKHPVEVLVIDHLERSPTEN